MASSTKGVKEVRNNLVVDPSHVAVGGGLTTASCGRRYHLEGTNQFADSPELRNYHIGVSASDDYVTLRGEVGIERERAAAERIARDTRGVNSVRNEISLANTTRNDRQINTIRARRLGARNRHRPAQSRYLDNKRDRNP